MADESEKKENPIAQLKEFAMQTHTANKKMMKRITEDLAYRGGDCYTDKDRENRGDKDESCILLLNQYINQIKNLYSQKPFGMDISAKSAKASASVTRVKSVLRGIEASGNAKAAITVAIDRQVTAGRGYVAITTDFSSQEGFDQEIRFEPVHNPDMVIWDRFSRQIAGADATECALVEHISCAKADELAGTSKDWDDMECVLDETSWEPPEDSVSLVTYFKLKRVVTTAYQGADGKVSTGKVPQGFKGKSRKTVKTTCMVYKIIGEEVIAETELPLPFLPVVPFLGQLIDIKKRIDWVGLVFLGRTPSNMVNWAASEAAARLAKAPKALLVVDAKSIINHKTTWDKYGRQEITWAPYDSHDPDDASIIYPAPEIKSVAVDVSDMAASQSSWQATLASVLGMSEAGNQGAGASNETAAAVLTRNKTMDISNYTMLDNASESVKQMTRVCMHLLPVIYDTERMIPVIDPKTGKQSIESVNLADLDIVADEFQVDVSAGPMAATAESERLAKLLAIVTVVGPEAGAKYEKYIAKASGALEQSDLDTLFPEATEGQDPEAVSALQQADTHITDLTNQTQQMQLFIQQIQSELASQKTIAASSIAVAQIQAKNRIDVEAMKQQGNLTAKQMQIRADADLAAHDAEIELEKQQQEIATKPTVVIQGDRPRMGSISGQRNDIFG